MFQNNTLANYSNAFFFGNFAKILSVKQGGSRVASHTTKYKPNGKAIRDLFFCKPLIIFCEAFSGVIKNGIGKLLTSVIGVLT